MLKPQSKGLETVRRLLIGACVVMLSAAGASSAEPEIIDGIKISTETERYYYHISNMRAQRLDYVTGDVYREQGKTDDIVMKDGGMLPLPATLPDGSPMPQIWDGDNQYMGLIVTDQGIFAGWSGEEDVVDPCTRFWYFTKGSRANSVIIRNAAVNGSLKRAGQYFTGVDGIERKVLGFDEIDNFYYVINLAEKINELGWQLDGVDLDKAYALSVASAISETSSTCLDMNNYVSFTKETQLNDVDAEGNPVMWKSGFVGVDRTWSPIRTNGTNEMHLYNNGSMFFITEVSTEAVEEAIEQFFATADGGKTIIKYLGNSKNIEIPEGATRIKSNFADGQSFESITLPSTIEYIEADAFANCTIGRVNIADWDKWYANIKLENEFSNPYCNAEVYVGGNQITSVEIPEGIEEIPDYVHLGLAEFKDKVILPSTLKRIGAYAFYNNKELCSVVMPEGLQEIGAGAFMGCDLLENTGLPSTLLSIDNSAFAGCTSLTEVTLPEGLTRLGDAVYSGASKIEKATLVAEIDSLGNELFSGCMALNKVYLPLKLRAIGERCFYNCGALEEITLPATLKTIGAFAFAYFGNYGTHGGLTSLTIPNSVTSIGEGAFQNNAISTLNLGSGLESIGKDAFNFCDLHIVNFAEGLKTIGESAFYNNKNIFSVKLPSTVNEISVNAFGGCNIGEMIIPAGVTALPGGSCGLPSVLTVGSGVKTISAGAFAFDNLRVLRMKANTVPALSDVLPITDDQNYNLTMFVNNGLKDSYTGNARWKKIENIVEESESDVIIYMTGDYALSEEIRTTTGLMPSQVTRMKVVGPLSDNDMRIISENMISLLSLDLRDATITAIADGLFDGSLLTSIVLPKGLTTIGNRAFANCSLLELSELPQGVTAIGSEAFANSPRVSISKLPDALDAVGYRAFGGCNSITSITANAALTSLGGAAFEGCPMLETADLSASALASISEATFSGCTALDEVILPASVTSIGDHAFASTALRDLAFAAEVSEIGYGAFEGCRRLVSANIPEGVAYVARSAFASCPKLISAGFPAGTTSVGTTIFDGDKKLASISCAASEAPAAETGAFSGIRTRYVSLVVPALSYRAYLNAPQWGMFQSIQNRIPVSIDPGVEVSNVAETEYQEMIAEDRLEELTEAAAQEPAAQSRARRRASQRAASQSGRQFAALFDGAQLQTGNDGAGTRIFINPEEGQTLASVLFNGTEMIAEMEGNSLLIPAGSKGALEIRAEGKTGIDEINADKAADAAVYNLQGVRVASSTRGLAPGIYIVNGKKVII